jgi:hypothetical protein
MEKHSSITLVNLGDDGFALLAFTRPATMWGAEYYPLMCSFVAHYDENNRLHRITYAAEGAI